MVSMINDRTEIITTQSNAKLVSVYAGNWDNKQSIGRNFPTKYKFERFALSREEVTFDTWNCKNYSEVKSRESAPDVG
jgi:hypothetical protein